MFDEKVRVFHVVVADGVVVVVVVVVVVICVDVVALKL